MNRPARRLVILLVDDDPADVLLISDALQASGNWRDIRVAGDGDEAVDFLRQVGRFKNAPRPDVVLLDLNMPGKDGRQVLTEIKADQKLGSIPIVVLSTSGDPIDIANSYASLANAYVRKPWTLEEQTEVVQVIDEFFTRIASLPSAV
jgi:CheY-like chemotaxis protein